MNHQQALTAAAIAWRDLKEAESHIVRLNRYPNKTPAMNTDFGKWSERRSAALAKLDELLKVQA